MEALKNKKTERKRISPKAPAPRLAATVVHETDRELPEGKRGGMLLFSVQGPAGFFFVLVDRNKRWNQQAQLHTFTDRGTEYKKTLSAIRNRMDDKKMPLEPMDLQYSPIWARAELRRERFKAALRKKVRLHGAYADLRAEIDAEDNDPPTDNEQPQASAWSEEDFIETLQANRPQEVGAQ